MLPLELQREFFEGHDRIGTLGIKKEQIDVTPLELQREVIEERNWLGTLIIKKKPLEYSYDKVIISI